MSNDRDRAPFVKYSDRCRAPHAGSSTCYGCDSNYWLDDDPYTDRSKKSSLQTASEIIQDIIKSKEVK